MVEHISCDPSTPLCLYDFTQKVVMIDYLAFTVPDLGDDLIKEDYFYPSQEEEEQKEPVISKASFLLFNNTTTSTE